MSSGVWWHMSSTRSDSVFALVDGNNFYVSCERLFNPKLHHRPVVVLSNNDGCCVARSNEAKAWGVAMGTPYFRIRQAFEQAGGIALSSNYTLYADLSSRMMSIIGQYSDRQELYSIDESFIEWTGFQRLGIEDMAKRLRAQVWQWIGIPVGIGIGSTKTLAKLANRLAKQHPDFRHSGVCNLASLAPEYRMAYLSQLDVGDVWGIGRRWSDKLKGVGVRTALELSQAPPGWIRDHFNVVVERTALELRGVSCLSLEEAPPPKKQIVSSRSFGTLVTDLEALQQAVSTYTARAAEKLRLQGSTTRAIQVFLNTPPFNSAEPQHHPSVTVSLDMPTNDTLALISAALKGLRRIYQPGYRYQKAGVMLLELAPAGAVQCTLFDETEGTNPRRQDLMKTLDTINRSMGRETLWIASQGLAKNASPVWRMNRANLSPAYTTRWQDLAKVRA